MSDFVVALAGGAVGSLLTLASRATVVPAEVRSNDRRARDRDVDLEQWVADETIRLRRELQRLRDDLAARGLVNSGQYGTQLGAAKEQTLQAYRDQTGEAARDVAAIYDREGRMHAAWRRITSKPRYELATPGNAEPVLDIWRAPLTRHLTPTDPPREIDDPTSRTLASTIEDVLKDAGDFE